MELFQASLVLILDIHEISWISWHLGSLEAWFRMCLSKHTLTSRWFLLHKMFSSMSLFVVASRLAEEHRIPFGKFSPCFTLFFGCWLAALNGICFLCICGVRGCHIQLAGTMDAINIPAEGKPRKRFDWLLPGESQSPVIYSIKWSSDQFG